MMKKNSIEEFFQLLLMLMKIIDDQMKLMKDCFEVYLIIIQKQFLIHLLQNHVLRNDVVQELNQLH
jgi:hypothetical protein